MVLPFAVHAVCNLCSIPRTSGSQSLSKLSVAASCTRCPSRSASGQEARSMAVNPSTSAGITIGSAVGSVGEWLRQITVRVISSVELHGSGVVWNSEGLIVTNAHVARGQEHEVEFADGRR